MGKFKWEPCKSCQIAVAVWNYSSQAEHHLSLSVGDLVCVLEECGEWYRGYLYYYPSSSGIFPISFVQHKESKALQTSKKEYYVPHEDPVSLEAKECLHQWKKKIFKAYAAGCRKDYTHLIHYSEDLMIRRWNLLHTNATLETLQGMKTELTAEIDRTNNLCRVPLSPRDDSGHLLDPQAISLHQLLRVHQLRQDEVNRKVPRTGWNKKKGKSLASPSHHIYLMIKGIDHSFPEHCELFFFLYDSISGKQLSERFLVNVPKVGISARRNSVKPTQYHALFTDLSDDERNSSGLFLVCQVIRKGKMLLDDKKNSSQHQFRRPYAVGITDVRPIVGDASSGAERVSAFLFGEDDDIYQTVHTMSLQVCSSHETDFSTLHTSLIRKSGSSKTPSLRTVGGVIALSLRAFQGDLQQLKKDYPYLEKKNAVLVNRLGYPSVILPGVVRNDIYVTLEQGTFEKGSKRAERNVEVAIAVVSSGGQILPQCIIPAAGATPMSEYESFIFYHNNYPKWNETFKLAIPLESIQDCHLRFAFRHVAKNEGKDKFDKTFSFAYMKIMREDGSIMPDGTHDLNMYKVDPKQKWFDPSMYLQLAPVREKTRTEKKSQTISIESVPVSSLSTLSRSGRENILISTLTCSTKLTQKVEMLHLLKWRTNLQELPTILRDVQSIDGGEIVKFLQDTLDCLFAILTSNSNMYGEAVFNAIVSILGRLSEDRYKQFVPVLDMYLDNHFSSTMAYKVLIWYFDQRVQNCHTNESCQFRLVEALKSMHFLFKFIIQSHKLFGRDPHFAGEIRKCFSSFNSVLGLTEDRFHGIHRVQGDILRNLPSILPEIIHIFSTREITQLLSETLDSIRNVHPSIHGSKMEFILAVFDSPVELMNTQGAREGFMQTVVSHLISHLTHTLPQTAYRVDDPGNKGCMNCIGKVLEILEKEEMHINFTDIESATPLLLPLLSKALECREGVAKASSLRAEISVCLIGVLRVMKQQHYAIFVDSLKERDSRPGDSNLRTFITNLQEVLQNLIVDPPHPKEWLSLHYTQNSVIVRVLRNISKALLDSFFEDKSFIPQVWDVYFGLCTSFATQPCLQLEELSDLHQAKMTRMFGDMREEVVKQVIVMWQRLKVKKGNFIPNLIGAFLSLTLIKNPVIRYLSLPLIQDMMKCEQAASQNFRRVETEVFDKIDVLLSDGQGDEEYRELFHEILMKKCKEELSLRETGPAFIDSVCRLIGLLLDYRSVENDDTYRGKRMGCMFNLLNFYNEIEKEELYIRYIYKLAELHERDDNFTEAGFTLLLHADNMEWSIEEMLPAEGCFPAQTLLDRKERLYNDAIRLFNSGKMWECGIRLCKELAELYEEQLYDYQKLSGILRTEADFFQRMITEVRVENEYFLVGYYGKGSPLFLRNKMFIHRGQPYEKLLPFIKRLMDEFPSAVLMKQKTTEPPDAEVQNSPGLFLIIRNVQPIVEEETLKDKSMPDKIAAYYKTNNVSRFRQDRPFHEGERDKDCEFATLWVERTTFTTSKTFPSMVTYLEVCRTKTVKLNPLELALQTVESKTKDICTLTRDIESNPKQSINPLSMLLKGVIDAAVMGGISHYDKIFFVPSYVKEHPDHQEKVRKLKTLIEEQVDVLRKALTLHSQRVPPDLQAFHQDLELRFEGFKDIVYPERRKRTSSSSQVHKQPSSRSTTIGRPLPPTPSIVESPPGQKRPYRRSTGIKSNSIISNDSLESPKPRRSATTKIRSSISQTPTERVSYISDSLDSGINSPNPMPSSSRTSSNTTSEVIGDEAYDDDDEYDNYEIVSWRERSEASAWSPSAPAYPAPHPPNRQDDDSNSSQDDLEDLNGYEKVRIRQTYPSEGPQREHAVEFGYLPCQEKPATKSSPQNFPPSFGGKPVSLSTSLPTQPTVSVHNSSENNDRMAVLTFPAKQKSPEAGAADKTPARSGMTLEEVRQRLLKSARQSVISEQEKDSERPGSVPRAVSQPHPIAATTAEAQRAHQTQSVDKPYFDHLFPQSQQSTPVLSSSVDVTDSSIYWDHLASKRGSESSGTIGTPLESVRGEYVLARSPENRRGVEDVLGELDSFYDIIRDPEEIISRERSPNKSSSPPKPMPYSKHKSPSPVRDSGPSSVQTPPPVPIKRRESQYESLNRRLRDKTMSVMENSESGRDPTMYAAKFHSESASHIYANQTQPIAAPRTRSSTLATGSSPSSPAPIAAPRKGIESIYHEQPPPRPPKTSDPPALPPKVMAPPPALPPKGKPSLPPKDPPPLLPPKPSLRSHH